MFVCLKAGSLALTPPGDKMSEVVSHCLPHRQLRVKNLSKVTAQWLEVDSNVWPPGYKAQNMPLHHKLLCYSVENILSEKLFCVCCVGFVFTLVPVFIYHELRHQELWTGSLKSWLQSFERALWCFTGYNTLYWNGAQARSHVSCLCGD